MFWDLNSFDAASGSGMAASLARDVMENALIDLNPVDNENFVPSSVNSKDTQREFMQHHKKRKRPSVPTSLQQQQERHGSGDVDNISMSTPVPLRIAALEALETLLTLVGIIYVICIYLYYFLCWMSRFIYLHMSFFVRLCTNWSRMLFHFVLK